ncbi:MAG: uroporphyrinogen-III C-methyltransferase [Candidatus Omnitrophica bacterium CG1_02_49_10]|nr:MAG: uroporphyrinogen-III C-methyltransferase [Candidatus Omnitrophica bacterium CG1_02_49_10]
MKAKVRKVYLVGAGPGDEKLITLKGFELIKAADSIVYDYLVNPALLKFRKKGSRLIYVGKKAGAHTLGQEGINKLLVKEARPHRTVLRLKGGDPFIFGRGAEEAAYLRKNGIDFEVVPGVTSAIAVPAYAGIPLTERSKNSTVGFITGHEDPSKGRSSIDWKALAKSLGTMVFLMGVGNIAKIAEKLIDAGKPSSTPIAVIRWGTTAKQETLTGTLKNIAVLAKKKKMSPPAIIVVGEAVTLRRTLKWFENKPLFSKRIIVTRTREQASVLSERLTSLGAEAIEIPTIKIVSERADKYIEGAFSKKRYDWIFFTSQNGVAEFGAFLDRSGKDSRIFAGAKICAIGSETAKSLNGIGIKPDYVPVKFVAESIVKHFAEMRHRRLEGAGALILRAKKARDILPAGLKKAGFDVEAINLYDTVSPGESRGLLREAFKEKVDCITFTSSSTVDNLVKLLGNGYKRKLSKIKIASIGPVTTSALKVHGLKANTEAKVFTIEGLVDAIVKGINR